MEDMKNETKLSLIMAAGIMGGVLAMGSGVLMIVNAFNSKAHAEDSMIPASRVKDAMQNMHCEKYADLPLNNNKVYRCDNGEVVCYITAPEAQMQCKFL
jgi:hypothetical protein